MRAQSHRFDTTGLFDWMLALDIGLTVASFIPGLGVAAMAAKVVIVAVKVISAVSKLQKAAKLVRTAGKLLSKASKLGQKIAKKFKSKKSTSCTRSFSSDTEVLMADGSHKPISDLIEGDMIWAADPETGTEGARLVTALWVHYDSLFTLETSKGDLVVTEDHPIWDASVSDWRDAQDLDGHYALAASGSLLAVGGITYGSGIRAKAYNITVEGLHTYFVVVGDEELLVHNTSCDLSVGQAASRVRKGQGPEGIKRIDVGKVKGEQPHAHFSHGGALNRNGTWKHQPRSGRATVTNKQAAFLRRAGWRI